VASDSQKHLRKTLTNILTGKNDFMSEIQSLSLAMN